MYYYTNHAWNFFRSVGNSLEILTVLLMNIFIFCSKRSRTAGTFETKSVFTGRAVGICNGIFDTSQKIPSVVGRVFSCVFYTCTFWIWNTSINNDKKKESYSFYTGDRIGSVNKSVLLIRLIEKIIASLFRSFSVRLELPWVNECVLLKSQCTTN